MADNNGTNRRNDEVDPDPPIWKYEESNEVLSLSDEGGEDQAGVGVEWHEQAKQDALEQSDDRLTIDADWNDVNFSPDEDEPNETSDQDIVDEIGKAMGVTYEDAEPLRPEEKLVKRDEERWELNPMSSEDYQERQTSKEGP